MRVTSQLWVSALIRRAQAGGAFVAVVKKGVPEAGAIYVVINNLDSGFTLYGPALQGAYDEEGPQDRLFEILMEPGPEAPVRERLESERNFDPDLWIVEIEDRESRNFIEPA